MVEVNVYRRREEGEEQSEIKTKTHKKKAS